MEVYLSKKGKNRWNEVQSGVCAHVLSTYFTRERPIWTICFAETFWVTSHSFVALVVAELKVVDAWTEMIYVTTLSHRDLSYDNNHFHIPSDFSVQSSWRTDALVLAILSKTLKSKLNTRENLGKQQEKMQFLHPHY